MCLAKPFDSASDSVSDAFSSSLEEDVHSVMVGDLSAVVLKKAEALNSAVGVPDKNVYNLVTRLAKTELNLPAFESKMIEDFSSDANEEEESRSSIKNYRK